MKKNVTEQDVRKMAAKETDKAVKELRGSAKPSKDGIKTPERNI